MLNCADISGFVIKCAPLRSLGSRSLFFRHNLSRSLHSVEKGSSVMGAVISEYIVVSRCAAEVHAQLCVSPCRHEVCTTV